MGRSRGAAEVVTGSGLQRYLVIDELQRTATTTLWRAYDRRLRREVTLESVRTELSAEVRAVLLRDAQTMARLTHPNLVAVYDAVVEGEALFVAMEHVAGTTLARWLEQSRPRPWRDIVAMFVAAGRGLAAAHAAGVAHHDFDAHNVLVGDDGRVRVGNFGLARRGAGYELPTHAVDDPAAEDQRRFCEAVRDALTLQPQGSDETASALPSHLPSSIRRALERGLAAAPNERWPTLQALLDALDPNPRQRAGVWLGVSGLVLSLGLLGTAWQAHRERQATRCSGAAGALAKAWDPERREQVRTALLAADERGGAEVWERVAPRLEAYAAAWRDLHVRTCEATTVHGDQPLTVMDLKMSCLHRANIELRAVTDLLAMADVQVVQNADDVIDALPDLQGCDDGDALQSEVPPPQPALREAVEAIRVQLAEVKALRMAGKYPETLARTQGLLEPVESIPYPPLHTELMFELGYASNRAGSYGAGESAFRRALRSALTSKQWATAGLAAMQLVNTLGVEQSRPVEALAYAQTAEALLGGARESELRAVRGNILQRLGRYADAEAEYRTAVALQEEAYVDLDRSAPRAALALNLHTQGRLEEAEEQQRIELALRERMLGLEHTATAHARFDLAHTLYSRGRYTEAEEQQRQVLAAWEKSLGTDHLNVATARANLGNMLAAQGRDAAAQVQYQAALDGQRKVLGPDHYMVSLTLSSHSAVLIALGRYADAEAGMRQSLAIDLRAYGEEHPEVAVTRTLLAAPLIRLGRYAEAEAEARRALAIFAKVDGFEHPRLPATLTSLAAALEGQGRYTEAESSLREALQLAPRSLGHEHPFLARIHGGLGTVLELQGRHDEAEAELRASLALLLAKNGDQHPGVAEGRGRLGSVLLAAGRATEAEAEYREAVSVMASTRGPDHPDLVLLQHGLGRSLVGCGRAAEGAVLLEKAWSAAQSDDRILPLARARIASSLAQALRESNGPRDRVRALEGAARALQSRARSGAEARTGSNAATGAKARDSLAVAEAL